MGFSASAEVELPGGQSGFRRPVTTSATAARSVTGHGGIARGDRNATAGTRSAAASPVPNSTHPNLPPARPHATETTTATIPTHETAALAVRTRRSCLTSDSGTDAGGRPADGSRTLLVGWVWLAAPPGSFRGGPYSEPMAHRSAATAGQRTAAYLVDALLLGPPLAAAVAAFDSRRERLRRGGTLALLAANLYHVLFEGTTGRTPGKRAVGIRVVGSRDGPCTYRAATLRTLARFVDFLPVGYLAAYASMALTERRRRLGDLLAGTVVIEGDDG